MSREVNLLSMVSKQLELRKLVGMYLLDMSAAFNLVLKSILIPKLQRIDLMDARSSMATMAIAIPTIAKDLVTFGHRSGHIWPEISQTPTLACMIGLSDPTCELIYSD